MAMSAAIAAIVSQTGADIPAIKSPTVRAIGISFPDHNNDNASPPIFNAAIAFVAAITPSAKADNAVINPAIAIAAQIIHAVKLGYAFANSVTLTIKGVTIL